VTHGAARARCCA